MIYKFTKIFLFLIIFFINSICGFYFIHFGQHLSKSYFGVYESALKNKNKNEYIVIKSYDLLLKDFKDTIEFIRFYNTAIIIITLLNISYLIYLGLSFVFSQKKHISDTTKSSITT